jgi:hypothetical protein
LLLLSGLEARRRLEGLDRVWEVQGSRFEVRGSGNYASGGGRQFRRFKVQGSRFEGVEIMRRGEEGNSVVPAAPALRPSAERKRPADAALIGVAKATPYQSGAREITPASKDARRGLRYADPSGGWRLTQVSEVARRSDPTSQKRDVGWEQR